MARTGKRRASLADLRDATIVVLGLGGILAFGFWVLTSIAQFGLGAQGLVAIVPFVGTYACSVVVVNVVRRRCRA